MMELICTALVMTALLMWIVGRFIPASGHMASAAVVMVLLMLPWPWGMAHWLPAYLGSFSLVTVWVAADSLGRRFGLPAALGKGGSGKLAWLLPLVALWFYPLSLGVSSVDPYALGFGDFRFSTALLLLGLYFWIGRDYALCLVLVAAQVAWRFEWLPSDNLWDYLIDPWLVFWALVCLGRGRHQVTPAQV